MTAPSASSPVPGGVSGGREYYQMAYNLSQLNRLKWVMETSLLKTLADKFRISVSEVFRRHKTQVETRYGPVRAIQVKVGRESKPPLVATWGGIPLEVEKRAILDDNPKQSEAVRTELFQRLLADICELCGSEDGCEVHHVRHLKDLERPGRRPKPEWVKRMAARQAKDSGCLSSLSRGIHAGDKRRTEAKRNVKDGEPDELKGSRPVRRGADGEVPTELATRQRPTLPPQQPEVRLNRSREASLKSRCCFGARSSPSASWIGCTRTL